MIQGVSENKTRSRALEKNPLLLQAGMRTPILFVMRPEGTPVTGLFNLVQLTLLFHAEHMLSQEWSSREGQKRC